MQIIIILNICFISFSISYVCPKHILSNYYEFICYSYEYHIVEFHSDSLKFFIIIA